MALSKVNPNFVNVSQVGGRRNLIINGDMSVAQRGTSSTAQNYQTADRWRNSWHASQTITQSQETLTSGDPYDAGFRKFLRMTQGTANSSATDYLQMSQRIEGLNIASSGWQFKSSNSFITASFWVRSSLAGEYQIYAQTRAATDKYYFKKFTIAANTWTKITCSIAGDSAIDIDYDNTSGFEFRIIPYYGTDYTGTRTDEAVWTNYNANELDDFPQNWCASSGATFDITGVQLEVGDTATPFEHRSYGEELRLCQRYYVQSVPGSRVAATQTSEMLFGRGESYVSWTYPVLMRATPSVVTSNDVSAGAGHYTVSSINNYTNGVVLRNGPNQYAMLTPSTNSGYNTKTGYNADAEL